MTLRRTATAALLATFAVGFAACGDDSETDGEPQVRDDRPPVATVDGKPITRAEFDEWYEASIKNSRSGGPGKEMAVVPDPPPYKRCLKGYDQIMTETARYLGIEHPKNECRVAWQSFMSSVMEKVLGSYGMNELARKHGIAVSDEEAKSYFARKILGTEQAKFDYGDHTYEDLVEIVGEENALERARTYTLRDKVSAALSPEDLQKAAQQFRSRVRCAPHFRMNLCSNPPKQEGATGPTEEGQ